MAIGAQVVPPHGYRLAPILGAIWLLWGAYGGAYYCIISPVPRMASAPGLDSSAAPTAPPQLLSCAHRPTSAWLDTLPLSRALKLKSGEFHASLRHGLGLAMPPFNPLDVQSGCGATLRRMDADHGMRCSALAEHQTTLRYGILTGTLRHAVHRKALPPHLSPHSAASKVFPTASHICRWLPLPPGCSRGHPPGHAPRHLHRQRVRHPPPLHQLSLGCCHISWRGRRPAGSPQADHICGSGAKQLRLCSLLRLVVQTYLTASNEASAPAWRRGHSPRRCHTSALCHWHPELSVGLCGGNFLMYHASGGLLARVSGRVFRAGLAVPTDEAIE
jgi:hypothetical protein